MLLNKVGFSFLLIVVSFTAYIVAIINVISFFFAFIGMPTISLLLSGTMLSTLMFFRLAEIPLQKLGNKERQWTEAVLKYIFLTKEERKNSNIDKELWGRTLFIIYVLVIFKLITNNQRKIISTVVKPSILTILLAIITMSLGNEIIMFSRIILFYGFVRMGIHYADTQTSDNELKYKSSWLKVLLEGGRIVFIVLFFLSRDAFFPICFPSILSERIILDGIVATIALDSVIAAWRGINTKNKDVNSDETEVQNLTLPNRRRSFRGRPFPRTRKKERHIHHRHRRTTKPN